MKILVLDAHSPVGLAVARSLARAGHLVDVGGEESFFNIAFYSRYPRAKIVYPRIAGDTRDFLRFFRELLAESDYDFIIPVTDRTIIPLHREGRQLPGFERVALPEDDALETTLNKERTLDIARELRVPIPCTWVCGDDMRGSGGGEVYPLVVKARYSKYLKDGVLISDPGPVFVTGPAELLASCRAKSLLIPRPLVQEMIAGDGYGYFVLARRGEPLLTFAHRRLREENPLGARSSYCRGIEPAPEMEDSALKLIRRLKWNGVAMVEFKRERSTGRFVLMEINGRFWGSLPLAIASGADFPVAYLDLLAGRAIPPSTVVYGRKARFLYAEVQHLVSVMHGPPPAWKGAYPTRGRTLWSFLSSFFLPGISYFNLTRDDPWPGLMENSRYLLNILPHRLAARRKA
ncbi:MAG TPA: ATP-grasp domain-containing protein [bacterium]|nr:ATP-grasp domain-containing protein [bacterium]HPJ71458.1 ATP-grasp domain-containing protein [bacterium]